MATDAELYRFWAQLRNDYNDRSSDFNASSPAEASFLPIRAGDAWQYQWLWRKARGTEEYEIRVSIAFHSSNRDRNEARVRKVWPILDPERAANGFPEAHCWLGEGDHNWYITGRTIPAVGDCPTSALIDPCATAMLQFIDWTFTKVDDAIAGL